MIFRNKVSLKVVSIVNSSVYNTSKNNFVVLYKDPNGRMSVTDRDEFYRKHEKSSMNYKEFNQLKKEIVK